MGELHHLDAIIRHMLGKIPVYLNHGTPKFFAVATHGKLSSGIASPFGKYIGEPLFMPGQEKVAEFMIVDGVCVGRISNPDVAGFAEIASVDCRDLVLCAIEGLAA